jgi:hypothetical protein
LFFFGLPLIYPQNYRKVRVGVQRGLCEHGNQLDNLVANINKDGRFTATVVDDADIEDPDELDYYDTIYLGGSGNGVDVDQISATAARSLADWVKKGGGLVTSGFLPTYITDPSKRDELSSVVPVNFDTDPFTPIFCTRASRYGVTVTQEAHPAVEDIPSSYFYVNAHCVFSKNGVNTLAGASSIASVVDTTTCPNLNAGTAPQAMVVLQPGSGRVVYLCFPYCGVDAFFDSGNLFINENTRSILMSSLWWTASIEPCPPDCDAGVIPLPPLAVILLLVMSLMLMF